MWFVFITWTSGWRGSLTLAIFFSIPSLLGAGLVVGSFVASFGIRLLSYWLIGRALKGSQSRNRHCLTQWLFLVFVFFGICLHRFAKHQHLLCLVGGTIKRENPRTYCAWSAELLSVKNQRFMQRKPELRITRTYCGWSAELRSMKTKGPTVLGRRNC